MSWKVAEPMLEHSEGTVQIERTDEGCKAIVTGVIP